MIHQSATCDSPECVVSVPTERDDRYPESWIVIELRIARDGLTWPTGIYGFHSRDCLTVWTDGRVKPKAAGA